MTFFSANADNARVARADAPIDPWLADTLPPDAADDLTFSKVDIDLDICAPMPEPVDLDLDLDLDIDAMASTDPMGVVRAEADASAVTTTAHSAGSDLPLAAQALSAAAPVFKAKPAPDPAVVWQATERRLPPSWTDKRVLLVSADESERMYLRARLALANLVWVDEAASTTQALVLLAARPYAYGFVNVDSVAIDGDTVATQLRAGNVAATLVLTSNTVTGGHHAFNLLAHWRRWRLSRHLGHNHNAEVLAKPLEPGEVIGLLSRLTTPLVV